MTISWDKVSNRVNFGALLCVELGRSPKDGAMTTINAAVNPELNKEDGAYYVDCKVTSPSSLARYVLNSTRIESFAA